MDSRNEKVQRTCESADASSAMITSQCRRKLRELSNGTVANSMKTDAQRHIRKVADCARVGHVLLGACEEKRTSSCIEQTDRLCLMKLLRCVFAQAIAKPSRKVGNGSWRNGMKAQEVGFVGVCDSLGLTTRNMPARRLRTEQRADLTKYPGAERL